MKMMKEKSSGNEKKVKERRGDMRKKKEKKRGDVMMNYAERSCISYKWIF